MVLQISTVMYKEIGTRVWNKTIDDQKVRKPVNRPDAYTLLPKEEYQ